VSDVKLSFWDRLSEAVESGRVELKSDNVLVRIDDDQGELKPGSIIVTPKTVKRTESRGMLGTVVAVGPGHHPELKSLPSRKANRGYWPTSVMLAGPFIPTSVRVGERVILESQLSGDEWPLRQGPHRLVRENEILAVIERELPAGITSSMLAWR
jgi:co-chaperonin GroES (HSP10)